MRRKIFPLFMIALAISACDKQETSTAAAPAEVAPVAVSPVLPQPQPPAAPVAEPVPEAPPVAAREVADPDTPISAYRQIDSNIDLLYIYYAFSGMPVDYELLAGQISGEYRGTSDGFKKQEIMAALKPKIDAKIEEMKSGRYFTLKTDLALNHYDFDLKSFPVQGMVEGLSGR